MTEMEPRRTRSSFMRSGKNTRMVKSTRVPSHELAKLKASKPMLVIPQPVLRIHECLDDNIRMAQVESNAYIALGIKEEPIDEEYDDQGRYYEDADFTPSTFDADGFYDEDACYDEEIEGKRTTRSSKRRRLAGLAEPNYNEDDNNNSKKSAKNKRSSKGKKTLKSPHKEFHPVVLSVESLAAPAEAQTAISEADLPPAQRVEESPEIAEGNNNHDEKNPIIDSSEPNKLISMTSEELETITPAPSDTSTSVDDDSLIKVTDNITTTTEVLLLSANNNEKELETSKTTAESEASVPENAVQTVINDSSVVLAAIEEEDQTLASNQEEEDPEYQATSSDEESEPETTRNILF